MAYKYKLHKEGDECLPKSVTAKHDNENCVASGKEIELHDLNYSQRETCENISSIIVNPNGSMEVKNSVLARSLWCFHGLGLKDKEELNQYSSNELDCIMEEVMERATKAKNPTEVQS